MKYQVNIDDSTVELTEEMVQSLNTLATDSGEIHLLQDNKSFKVNLLHADWNNKTMTLEVNGEKFDLKIEDEYDQLVKKMGLDISGKQTLKNIKAPMPGLVLDILVKPGQTIQEGDQLLILEAMKMENVLKATGEGVVKSIEVKKAAAVDKGQVLIEME